MDETRARPADAILDALDEAIQEGNLDRAAIELESLRSELTIEREVGKLGQAYPFPPSLRRDYPPGD